jgi:O-antigen ligase
MTAQVPPVSVRAPSSRLPEGAGTVALGAAVAVGTAAATVALGPLALVLPVVGAIAYLLVRYPLVLYVAFLYIGLFKGRGAIDHLPVDVTLLLGALLAAVCLLRLVEGRFRLPPLMLGLPYVLIAALMAISLIWTPELAYGTEKTLKFASFTALATFAPYFLVDGRAALRQLLILLGGVGVVGALIVLSLGSTSGEEGGRLVFNEAAGTIFTARFLLTGAFVLLLGAALRLWRRQRVPIALVGIAVVVVAASIGSRGPLVGFVLALICTVVAIVLREPRRILPVLLTIAVGVAALPFISLPETSSERISGLVKNPSGAFNEDLRSRLYDKGLELAEENPVRGIGAGGFFIYSYVVTNREERYPHNIFLEMAAELGIAPTLLLAASILAMLAILYKRAWSASGEDRTLIYLLAGVFLVNFFATQLSGDFNDNKTFWAMLGLGWLVAAYGLKSADESAVDEKSPPPERLVAR